MKLSEAILLGRHLCKPQAAPDADNAYGCALSMASLAAGEKSEGINVWVRAKYVWPWLRTPHDCRCPYCDLNSPVVDTKALFIAHVFDKHVFSGEMTLEQLVDYVRSIEPAAEVPPELQSDKYVESIAK